VRVRVHRRRGGGGRRPVGHARDRHRRGVRIGVETARALAGAGAEVTLAVRDTDAGARTAADIAATTGGAALHVERLDLADRASVAAFAAGWDGPLHLLVNNAGVMA